MNCEEARRRLHAFHDRALPEPERMDVQHHIACCTTCSEQYQAILDNESRVRAALAEEPVPHGLWPRIRAEIAKLQRASTSRAMPTDRRMRRAWVGAAAIAGAIIVAFNLVIDDAPQTNAPALAPTLANVPVMELRAFIDSRRPVDVESTDPAYLREWFVERVDFSPPTVSANIQDAELIGGRLCFFLARRVASYMYRVDDHLISLYVMPDGGLTEPRGDAVHIGERPATVQRIEGFNHIMWREDGLLYSLVSDLPQDRLLALAGGLAGGLDV